MGKTPAPCLKAGTLPKARSCKPRPAFRVPVQGHCPWRVQGSALALLPSRLDSARLAAAPCGRARLAER